MIEGNIDPAFSPLLGADHLFDALKSLGFAGSSGFGPQPISWQELVAYAQATGEFTEPWEFRAVSGMSRSYCEGLHLGEGMFAQPPWHEDEA